VLVLAACSGGCLSTWVGSGGLDEPFAYHPAPLSSGTEHLFDATPPPAGPRDSGVLAAFGDHAARMAHDITHQDASNPILERMAARQVEDIYGLDGEGSNPVETRRAFSRFARKAVAEAVRQQGAYQQVRDLFRDVTGGNPFPPVAAGPRLDDPARDGSAGTARLFPDGVEDDLFRKLSPSEFDTHIGLGARPSLGISWMRFYSFSWEPADGELIHRVEYTVGGVELGAAYRLVDGGAADAGVGMQFRLGRSRVSLSASRALHAADGDQTPGEQQVMAELAWRF
jgi:hypothetical protein